MPSKPELLSPLSDIASNQSQHSSNEQVALTKEATPKEHEQRARLLRIEYADGLHPEGARGSSESAAI